MGTTGHTTSRGLCSHDTPSWFLLKFLLQRPPSTPLQLPTAVFRYAMHASKYQIQSCEAPRNKLLSYKLRSKVSSSEDKALRAPPLQLG